MFKKNMLILIILVFCSVGFALADNDIHDREDSADESIEPNGTENIPEYTERVADTRRTDPRMFDDARESKSTVAIYGTVPFKEGGDAYKWDRALDRICSSAQDDEALANYHMKAGGPVNHYGYNIFGFVTVYLHADQADQIKQQDIEDIKNIFDKYAEKEGITDLPILFRKWDAVPVPDPGEAETMPAGGSGGFFSSIISFIKNVFGM